MVDLIPSELVSGLDFVNLSEPGSPVNGDNFITASGELKVRFDGSFSFLATATQTITLTNNSGTQIEPAECVIMDSNGDVAHSSSPNTDYRVLGFAKDQIADSASGEIYMRGIVPGLVDRSGGGEEAGLLLIGPTINRVGALTKDIEATPTFGAAIFGILLEDIPGGSGNFTAWCRIWR